MSFVDHLARQSNVFTCEAVQRRGYGVATLVPCRHYSPTFKLPVSTPRLTTPRFAVVPVLGANTSDETLGGGFAHCVRSNNNNTSSSTGIADLSTEMGKLLAWQYDS